jgi:hypothetical protein
MNSKKSCHGYTSKAEMVYIKFGLCLSRDMKDTPNMPIRPLRKEDLKIKWCEWSLVMGLLIHET